MKKTIRYTIVSTVLSACAIVGLAACVVSTETESTASESSPVVAEPESASGASEPMEITVEESIISVDTAKLSKARTLKVGVDHPSAIITIRDNENNVLDELTASDCAARDQDYHMCSFRLPAGEYVVEFGSVSRYETPESLKVNLKWGGTEVYGSYAEDPSVPEAARPSLGLPGIGDSLAF